MRFSSILRAAVLVVCLTAATSAQSVPVRPLGAATAVSTETFSTIMGVRAVPGGVLVNDVARRRVLMLDPTLKNVTVVADSTSNTATAYGGRIGGLIAYRADSTLFVDPQSLSILVINPAGKIARVMSVPVRQQDMMSLVGPASAAVGFDQTGRLVYRSQIRPNMAAMMGANGAFTPPTPPDSAMIVRVDLATRKVDTLAYFKIPKTTVTVSGTPEKGMSIISEFNPLPVTDDFAVLSDGSVVIVRGQDYHVDRLGPDGKLASAAKIPFDWQRLTDEDKVAFIDSVKTAMEKARANPPAPGAGGPTIITNGGPVIMDGGRAGGGGGGQVMTFMRGGAEAGAAAALGGGGGMQQNLVSPSTLPDYKPPFSPGALRPDADGNLWIRTIPTKPLAGGPVYDVINAKGELIDRVQIPASRTIVGFGPGGTVYMSVREGSGLLLEKAKVR